MRRRTLGPDTRAARVLAWSTERGIEVPSLDEVGQQLLVQRAASRLPHAPTLYLRGMGSRYRRFRRAAQPDNRWYGTGAVNGGDADPLEIDLILLALLRATSAMERDRLLTQRLGNRAPALIGTAVALRRHQILVDEATEFSPVQLACMAQLARGARWLYPDISIKRIDVAYRQSRR